MARKVEQLEAELARKSEEVATVQLQRKVLQNKAESCQKEVKELVLKCTHLEA